LFANISPAESAAPYVIAAFVFGRTCCGVSAVKAMSYLAADD
jgi:hypothetical protein